MRVEYKFAPTGVEVLLFGELDHHAARESIAEIHAWLDQTMPSRLTLDMGHISFMDSSGIALILSLYKRMRAQGGSFSLRSLPPAVKRLLKAAGVERIVDLSA